VQRSNVLYWLFVSFAVVFVVVVRVTFNGSMKAFHFVLHFVLKSGKVEIGNLLELCSFFGKHTKFYFLN